MHFSCLISKYVLRAPPKRIDYAFFFESGSSSGVFGFDDVSPHIPALNAFSRLSPSSAPPSPLWPLIFRYINIGT